MWVGYDVGCTMVLNLGRGAWQIDRLSNGSMWNSYSFQPVAQWMGNNLFTDLGAEGCCGFLNAFLWLPMKLQQMLQTWNLLDCVRMTVAVVLIRATPLVLLSITAAATMAIRPITPSALWKRIQVQAIYHFYGHTHAITIIDRNPACTTSTP